MKNIRIGTFNLYQFAEPPTAWYKEENKYKPEQWTEKLTWIKNHLAEMKIDIVGFQEVFSPDKLKELVSSIGLTHFATVDTPGQSEENSNIYVKPIVALASRYPIQAAEPVTVDSSVLKDLPVTDGFKFSRAPIQAVVNIEGYSPITVVVAHLKSKRPVISQPVFEEDESWENIVMESLRARSRGQIASLLQRGAEAAALYHKVSAIIKNNPENPVIVMGDLNDDVHSIPIEALSNQSHVFEINGIHSSKLPWEAKKAMYDFKLYNSFDLAPNQDGLECKPTHYHNGKGGILDYIFVSNGLNERNDNEVGRILSHKVYDAHLHKDGVGDHKQSDHAQVVTEILLIK